MTPRLYSRVADNMHWKRGVYAIVASVSAALVPSAFAFQTSPAGSWVGTTGVNTSATSTFNSGLTVTMAVAGSNLSLGAVNASLFGGPGTSMYTYPVPLTGSGLTFTSAVCGAQLCPNEGTVKISFNRTVHNPLINVSGLGSLNTVTAPSGANTYYPARTSFTLTTSTPAGATLGAMNAGATNIAVTGGNKVDLVSTAQNGVNCTTPTFTGAALAGCGSIQVVGDVQSVTLRADLLGVAGSDAAADTWSLVGVAVGEDYGDAPASYDATAAASSIMTDLRLGSLITPEGSAMNSTATPVTPSPIAVGAGANANTGGDGASDDGVSTPFPTLTTAMVGATYTRPVTVTRATGTTGGKLCGWIDFNRNGLFDTSERACSGVLGAGASQTVPLAWTVPANMSAGATYARFRVSNNETGVLSPNGMLDSGEVEDYSVAIMPVVKVVAATTPAGDPGTFDLGVGGTVFAPAVSNGGTTGFQSVFNTSAYGAPAVTIATDVAAAAAPVSFNEAGAGLTSLNDYTTTYSCVDGTGAVVTTGTGAVGTVSIPKSLTGAAALASKQTITCTYTNVLKPVVAPGLG